MPGLDALRAEADANVRRHIAENPYPGRGLIIGRAEDGAWLQVYWIMGRSPNSRNRRFAAEGATLRTEPLDPEKVENPHLVIYEAMLELPDLYLVSNGDQTRTLADALAHGDRFEDALATRAHEDDPPIHTPRISGMLDLRGHTHGAPAMLALSILRANAADPEQTDRVSFRPALPPPGFGYCLTTYEGDGNPLPPFRGDPRWLPLAGSAEDVLGTYWEALDTENRVAAAVKRIPAEGGESSLVVRNHT